MGPHPRPALHERRRRRRQGGVRARPGRRQGSVGDETESEARGTLDPGSDEESSSSAAAGCFAGVWRGRGHGAGGAGEWAGAAELLAAVWAEGGQCGVVWFGGEEGLRGG